MRVAGQSLLVAVSLGAHLALAAGLGSIPPRRHREVVAITVSESKKPKTPPKEEHPPEPEPPTPAPRPVRAKTAPAPAKTPLAAPASNTPASSFDSLPDFGVSMTGGGPGGVAVPAGGGGGPAPTTASAKTLSRAAMPKNDCDDPPAKPKILSHPVPIYPTSESPSGLSGKVRVEITVDEHGRISGTRVLQGLGPAFDAAALAAARASTFEAAVRCGRPSTSTFRITYSFAPQTP